MREPSKSQSLIQNLQLESEVAWILAESGTLFVATAKFLKLICDRLEWDCGTIWAVDQEANVLRCTRVWQTIQIQSNAFKTESQNLALSLGIEFPGQVWKERKAIWIQKIHQEQNFLRKISAEEIGLNSALIFPVIYENKVLAIVEFYCKKFRNPRKDLLQLFDSLGHKLGNFLINKHMEKQMLYLTEHDVLTGLSNKKLLEQYLDTALITAKENDLRLAVLSLDLDRFKEINDSMGYQVGDLVLKEVSEIFSQSLRPGDIISRVEGDKFLIVLLGVSKPDEIEEIIGRLQVKLLSLVTNLNAIKHSLTASIGISRYPENGNTVHALVKCADLAMYTAKERGRNTFQYCSREMSTAAENRNILQINLRHALDNNEFFLHYQPKIDTHTKKVTGMEALIRWKRPDAIIMPEHFIPAAEGSGLIMPIAEWVIKTACAQNKIWEDAGLPPITLSINLSARNLNTNLLYVLEKILLENKLNSNAFEIELTESVLLENVDNNIQILTNLKEMGIKISIDDFGTGYSSLSYLKLFPIDTIKIDQSFVRGIPTSADDAAIVIAIITLAHSLNFKVIAEGVESEAQLKFLCEQGCDEIQGFYFASPMSAEEATHFIQKNTVVWPF